MTHLGGAISRAALEERDGLCSEALKLSIHLYGVEAGNLALKIMATGGVYQGAQYTKLKSHIS